MRTHVILSDKLHGHFLRNVHDGITSLQCLLLDSLSTLNFITIQFSPSEGALERDLLALLNLWNLKLINGHPGWIFQIQEFSHVLQWQLEILLLLVDLELKLKEVSKGTVYKIKYGDEKLNEIEPQISLIDICKL